MFVRPNYGLGVIFTLRAFLTCFMVTDYQIQSLKIKFNTTVYVHTPTLKTTSNVNISK